MKIIVTGATGFIGKNFLSTVKNDGNYYLCLIREESKIDDIEHFSNIEFKRIKFVQDELEEVMYGANVVIHMVGQMGGYGVTKEQFENANCKLTNDILQACIVTKIKQLIYLSTPGVQGFGKRLCVESEPYAPRNLYEKTKVESERMIINTLTGTEVKYTILRPDFVYGPGDYRRIRMYKNIRDKKFVLTVSGKAYLNPTYVMDVVQGIKCSVGNIKGYDEIFNISSQYDITVKEYLNVIAGSFSVPLIKINIGHKLSVLCALVIEKVYRIFLKKEGFVTKNQIDFLAMDHSTSSEKAQKILNYKPEYDFKQGFELTMKWCKKNRLL